MWVKTTQQCYQTVYFWLFWPFGGSDSTHGHLEDVTLDAPNFQQSLAAVVKGARQTARDGHSKQVSAPELPFLLFLTPLAFGPFGLCGQKCADTAGTYSLTALVPWCKLKPTRWARLLLPF